MSDHNLMSDFKRDVDFTPTPLRLNRHTSVYAVLDEEHFKELVEAVAQRVVALLRAEKL